MSWTRFWTVYVLFGLLCLGIAVSCGGCTPFDLISLANASGDLWAPSKPLSYAEWKAKNCHASPC